MKFLRSKASILRFLSASEPQESCKAVLPYKNSTPPPISSETGPIGEKVILGIFSDIFALNMAQAFPEPRLIQSQRKKI